MTRNSIRLVMALMPCIGNVLVGNFSNGMTSEMVKLERSEALLLSNKLRVDHHVPKLVMDDQMNKVAQDYAEYLAKTGFFQHGDNGYGENLYTDSGYGQKGVGVRAVRAWYDEVKEYPFHSPGFSMATEHFTQMVWKGTSKVGIGVALARDMRSFYVVVNYDPPGNVRSSYEQNVFPK